MDYQDQKAFRQRTKHEQRLVKEHGAVPPPYVVYPTIHPIEIFWRMGHGESYKYFFSDWLQKENMTEEARIEYFRKFPPPPLWLTWTADCIWRIAERAEEEGEDEDETEEFSLDPYEFDYWVYFRRMAALGFGTELDCKRAWDEVDDELEERQRAAKRAEKTAK